MLPIVFLTLAFAVALHVPESLFVTVPLVIIWASHKLERRRRRENAIAAHNRDKARTRAARNF